MLLERADSDDADVWDELWSGLCHQGTVYRASYAAVPRLAELAAGWRHATLNHPLFLATCILASTDGPERPGEVPVQHPGAVHVLRQVAERAVQAPSDDADFVYVVQALLATEGDSVWATRLDALAGGELEIACPSCDEQLLLLFDPSTGVGGVTEESGEPRVVVRAADPARLTGQEKRAYEVATANGRQAVADSMLTLFGVVRCARCGYTVRTADAFG